MQSHTGDRGHTIDLWTTADYFELLATRARRAADLGNYAISAALVLRDNGRETICEGWNTLFADDEPSGHAEMNAIRLCHALTRPPDDRGAATLVEKARALGALHARPCGDQNTQESILYTTLEPCPMCTVCLINAGVQHVVIAAEDPPSGTLESSRLERLPPLWPQLAGSLGLRVTFCQSEDPANLLSHLPVELREQLLGQFAASRTKLDESLGEGGVLDFEAAGSRAWELLENA